MIVFDPIVMGCLIPLRLSSWLVIQKSDLARLCMGRSDGGDVVARQSDKMATRTANCLLSCLLLALAISQALAAHTAPVISFRLVNTSLTMMLGRASSSDRSVTHACALRGACC